ncbi:polyprenyl synthetase family protein [Actinomadura scrupuli]|uniref:polyprenyl synthetase family protein n=1 Tax=Actinomadura scrupuli TaxID=559629 RepID=UPI003D9697AC
MTVTKPEPAAGLCGESHPILERVRGRVFPALREAVDKIGEHDDLLGRIVGYHLGWNDAAGAPGEGDRGGRTVALVLTALAAEAVGASTPQTLSCAVAMELAKDFTQLQDDIIDNDEQRRERASAWRCFGVGPVLLGADAMRNLALETLARNRPHGHNAMWHLQDTLSRVAIGQARDLSFEQRPWSGPRSVTLPEYRAMAEQKAAALFECALSLGAVLHGADPGVVSGLVQAGHDLGLASQALDDLLDIWGPPGPPGSGFNDLRQGKKSLPIIAALATGTEAARDLAHVLSGPLHDEDRLRLAADLIDAAGGRHAAEREARSRYRAAMARLGDLQLPCEKQAELIEVSALLGLRGANQSVMLGTL